MTDPFDGSVTPYSFSGYRRDKCVRRLLLVDSRLSLRGIRCPQRLATCMDALHRLNISILVKGWALLEYTTPNVDSMCALEQHDSALRDEVDESAENIGTSIEFVRIRCAVDVPRVSIPRQNESR